MDVLKPQLEQVDRLIKLDVEASKFRLENCLGTVTHEITAMLKATRVIVRSCARRIDECPIEEKYEDDEGEWYWRYRDEGGHKHEVGPKHDEPQTSFLKTGINLADVYGQESLEKEFEQVDRLIKLDVDASMFRLENCLKTRLSELVAELRGTRALFRACLKQIDECPVEEICDDDGESYWYGNDHGLKGPDSGEKGTGKDSGEDSHEKELVGEGLQANQIATIIERLEKVVKDSCRRQKDMVQLVRVLSNRVEKISAIVTEAQTLAVNAVDGISQAADLLITVDIALMNIAGCATFTNFATDSSHYLQAKACLKTNREDFNHTVKILQPQLEAINNAIKLDVDVSKFRVENCLANFLHDSVAQMKVTRTLIERCAGRIDDCPRRNRDDDENDWYNRYNLRSGFVDESDEATSAENVNVRLYKNDFKQENFEEEVSYEINSEEETVNDEQTVQDPNSEVVTEVVV
ncbi:hypothetical protein pipiens_011077 [Culex pipiens pipiens]|uniref:Uncharacterized protein n=1 Tax=Culex pipiens pipiens TaxID=38569 RepID=A0ABD1D7Q1_CULPP